MGVLIYEKKGKIAYITLNRPEKLNAITIEMINELAKAWVDFRDDSSLLVAILSGAGKSFCVGADLSSIGQPGWELSRVLPATHKVWKPVIGALHGNVLGGAFWLALGTDIRVAAEGTSFGFPEAKVGAVVKTCNLLPLYMPANVACELMFTGNRINAQRAYELSIINKVVPASQLLSAATELAEAICENSPLPVRVMKQGLKEAQDIAYQGTDSGLEDLFATIFQSQDFQEGINAFKEKRKPNWQGR